MDNLQNLYSEYAFLNEPHRTEGEAKRRLEPYHQIGQFVERTYEDPLKWYFVVFKPFDRAYERDPHYFMYKGLSKCRDAFKRPEAILLTKEQQSNKVHINALVCTRQEVQTLHDKSYCNKYKIYVDSCDTLAERLRVRSYIMKESKNRTFEKYLDYIEWSRK